MRIDLNADLGEGFGIWRLGDDEALLQLISSANIACGFHAGDPLTMRRTCELAQARGVAIGAQVGYRDLAGFGRRAMAVAPDELAADVLYQLGALHACATAAGARVAYVKPHGALYNTAADDEVQARAVVVAVQAFDGSLPVLGLRGSALERAAAAAGTPFVGEAFADRAYTAQGRLVARTEPGAVLDDPAVVVDRAVAMARDGVFVAVDGTTVPLQAESLCLHGDNPNAVTLARLVREALVAEGFEVAPFRGGAGTG